MSIDPRPAALRWRCGALRRGPEGVRRDRRFGSPRADRDGQRRRHRAGTAARTRPGAPLPRRHPRGRRRLPADPRRDQLRLRLVPDDPEAAGVCEFGDLDRLTIFADNLVPHVLRVDGVLVYDDELASRIDRGQLLEPGGEEREIRACAVHAGELIAAELGVPPRVLDTWLWNRGQEPRYKAVPRHRCRTVFY